MSVLHITNHHVIVKNGIQSVQNRVQVQIRTISIGIYANRVTGNACLRIDIVDTCIDLITLTIGIVMEAQHLTLWFSV